MCHLGPCELPRHIRDQLVVRQRMILWEKKAGPWGPRLINNVLGHSISRVSDTVIHFSSNIPFVLSTSSEHRGTIRVAKCLSEGKTSYNYLRDCFLIEIQFKMTQVVNAAPSSFLIMVSAVVYQKITSTHVKNKNTVTSTYS